ncbi:26S PROTEASOME REGULATORY SUBUNIT 3 [Encephalitozoon cuniculi GB-M1]|uniref:26S proteasome regulatory subunit RPN3 n=2 Tax=Encephalitozoon cuniculi TaxID=6035 RepID=RPN3_ENCCU|nr:PCI domain-containing protein [Encephalitozoon cuniculi GB-M1]Q8SRT7.1 RecName: Full=26S proteasome regulatory subunit RPN3 [Encephalitozoon cuniculi GB-M1]AGE95405.1 26S proteasome regulatory subunit 3 [Encephalitozoon cuniculi]KMV66211.1 PCI domain-containing protein [Encephalitozoon cuniculi EcunIII-L]UYI27952.1 proteasome non-atpase regulatory subunit 3 [Encephalitozoon cuniculi]CAD26674.1 26S PROTEASOME REGULATORY SUBUNIT 3 [Encephalitozoon cuniculi GB-M1]
MDEKECVAELVDVLSQLSSNREEAMDRYERQVFTFIRNIKPETLDSLNLESELERIAAYPVILGALFMRKEFKKIDKIVNENLLSHLIGKKRVYDYFVGLIVKFLYLARKNECQDNSALFSLLVTNKELGNEYTVSVITNCLLDMLIGNKIFQRIDNSIVTTSEQARYNYYNGIIFMVEGDYESALKCFHTCVILSTNRDLVLGAEKRVILCMLLSSDYSIPYPCKPSLRIYFKLASAVKRADIKKFEETLESNKDELMSQGLYFVAKRLSQNVIQEGIRKISVVYSRISYEDIAHILGINSGEVEYLVKRTIRKGLIKGKVADGIFYSLREDKSKTDIGIGIRDCIQLANYIQEHMRYPAIEPLCYEKVRKVHDK